MDAPGGRLSILDEANPYRGAGPDGADSVARIRSAKRMSVLALVLALLWGVGFLSVGAIGSAIGAERFLAANDAHSGFRTVAKVAIVLGVIGVIAAIAVGLQSSFVT